MWIVKIGGSWINNPNLSNLIKNLQRLSNKDNIIIVNGGGVFSDSVRLVYESKRMSEKTGNYIALKATELFSHLLQFSIVISAFFFKNARFKKLKLL